MKVLMLGWEFPPHISGGLGTACAGLTQALEKQHVDVVFVVPKLHGGEQSQRTTFVSASSIPIRQKKLIAQDLTTFVNSPLSNTDEPFQGKIARPGGSREVIAVSSSLTPYTVPFTTSFQLEKWNYSFILRNERTLPANLRSKSSVDEPLIRRATRYVKEPFFFSGGYGPNLLEEVERYSQAVAEIARHKSFDVIHAHDWMTYKAGLAARKVSGKPLVVHVHATEIDRSGAWINQRIFDIEREGMTKADRVVTVSDWTRRIAIQHYAIDREKITVVHNGISPREQTNLSSFSPPIGAKVVTFLGRITHQKGPMYFVEAARKVHAKFPDVHFIVAGSGDQLPIMIERIAQLRLSNRFHFTGFLKGEDIDKIWAMSNVYVMPSVSEPFGIAPLEAIQAGVPVILSKQAGVSEVMPHAIKVDFWNVDAFAEAICNVLRFKSLANTLKKNGAEEIKNLTWDKAAKKLTTLYHELGFRQEKKQKSGFLFSGSPTKKASRAAVL
jgi:glycosyltransferase involved in cell wall biosynthesis